MRFKRREKNVELIRPLLRIYKTDLLRACEESGIPYMTDSSNLSTEYTRNSLRLDVLPFLGQYNDQLAVSLNRLAEVASAEDDFWPWKRPRHTPKSSVRTKEGQRSKLRLLPLYMSLYNGG
ncbi:hypothetical protein HMSSN036_61240 [Paenibacillus macerans]|nr:hypothetical protein HMSSN036_61240 [Paenibacillus macerans]